MLISIVIPVYNVPIQLLKRCLKSILLQIDNNAEIVVIDDGSNSKKADSYIKICDKDSRIKYYRQENSGVSSARNRGVEYSKGEYILFVDADDYITDGCIGQAKEAINNWHPDIVFGYVYKDFNDKGTINHNLSANASKRLLFSGKKDMARILNHILGYEDDGLRSEYGYIADGPVCRFFRKVLFEKARFDVRLKWNEDTIWNIELLNHCNTAVICKSRWYIYAIRNDSAMQIYRANCYEEFMCAIKKEMDISDRLWNTRINKGIAYRVWGDIFVLSRSYIFNKHNKMTFFDKYNDLKCAIESKPYQKAIRLVDFGFEQRETHKIIKRMLNKLMKYKFFLGVYFIISTTIRK